jgi:hypothetical protein
MKIKPSTYLSKTQAYLQTLYPKASFDITFVKTGRDDIHDRYIFTNAHWIQSGNSFSFFKNGKLNSHKPTTLTVMPLTSRSIFNAAQIHLGILNKIIQNSSATIGTEERVAGSRMNRLFLQPTKVT